MEDFDGGCSLVLYVATAILGLLFGKGSCSKQADDRDTTTEIVYCRANDAYYHEDDGCCAGWSDTIEAIPTTLEYATEVLHRHRHLCTEENDWVENSTNWVEVGLRRDSAAAADTTTKPIWWPAEMDPPDYSHVRALDL